MFIIKMKYGWSLVEGTQHGWVFGFGNCGTQLLYLNSSKTLMYTPPITNLDDMVQCESFQEAFRAQVQQIKN